MKTDEYFIDYKSRDADRLRAIFASAGLQQATFWPPSGKGWVNFWATKQQIKNLQDRGFQPAWGRRESSGTTSITIPATRSPR